MPIVIKEIRVSTVVEKRIVREHEISEDVYKRIKEDVLEELEERTESNPQEERRITLQRRRRWQI